MKKISILIIGALLLSFTLTACATPAAEAPAAEAPAAEAPAAEAPATVAPTTAPAAPAAVQPVYEFDASVKALKPYKIAIVLKNFTNAVWLQHVQHAELAAKELGFEISSYAPEKPENIEEQIRILEDLIAKKVDCVVLAPTNSESIAAGIVKLNEAGIPVAYDNTRGSGGDYLTYVGLDNEKLGNELGEYIAEKMNYEGKLLILEGVPGQSTSDLRTKGVKDVLVKYPNIEYESQPAHWQFSEALDITNAMLAKWPDLKAIVAVGSNMSEASAEAVAAAGMSQDDIIIGSFDVTPQVVTAIRNGVIDFTIEQGIFQQAYWSVAACVQKLNGMDVPQEMRTPVTFVDINNLDQFAPKE
jgi:ABC-type sugar transport system substrate-binding protein